MENASRNEITRRKRKRRIVRRKDASKAKKLFSKHVKTEEDESASGGRVQVVGRREDASASGGRVHLAEEKTACAYIKLKQLINAPQTNEAKRAEEEVC